MELKGERIIAAEQDRVWRALRNPQVLQACVPGCESIEQRSESAYDVLMIAAVGPVKAKFKGTLSVTDVEPGRVYELSFEGQGGIAGFAKGGARVELDTVFEGTRLTYLTHASVGGKIAQVGSRLVDGAAKKLAESFFEKLQEQLATSG